MSPSSNFTVAKLCALAVIVTGALFWLRPGPSMASGPAAQVAAGGNFSCALTWGREVLCWGNNTNGQLGDGSLASRNFPAPVHLGQPASWVVAGSRHACAQLDSGTVKCWGLNADGQLGNGTTVDRSSPVPVAGLTDVIALTAGAHHTCALVFGGAVKCWGDNSGGQLGDGTTTDRNVPGWVAGLSSAVSVVDAGGLHTCATLSVGGAVCWGSNSRGQLGDGSGVDSTTPIAVSGLSGYLTSITAGDLHTCANRTSGPPLCWGANGHGQVGDGTTVDRATPVAVSALSSGAFDIVAGARHTCALTTNFGISCWGENTLGQLGDGSTADRHTPVAVCADAACSSPLYDIFSADGGGDHTCAMAITGGPWCWGQNAGGQLGDGTYVQRSTPVEVLGMGYVPGDVNCDKRVNSIDAAIVLQVDAGLPIMVSMCYWSADLNHDGNINAIDAAIILQVDAGLIVII